MRFNRLEINAFGHFTNYDIPFEPNHSFHILYGNNEAGKSTLLRSITQLLYGIPHNSKDSFLHPNSKLRIGGSIANSAGKSITFYRRKGKSKTLLGEDGQAIPDNSLVPFINVLSEDTFRSMFALNHETLREGGETLLQSNGNVGESLFAAASGLNAIKNVMADLDSESRNLYKAGGSKPMINELIRKEKDLTKKINESLMLARQWKELEKEYKDGQATLTELREKYAQVTAAINKLEKVRKAHPKIMDRDLLLKELAEYETVPSIPSDCSLQRRDLSKTIHDCGDAARMADEEAKQLKAKLEGIVVDERILQEESIIHSLNSDIGAYEKEIRDYAAIKGNAENRIHQINDLLAYMGYGKIDEVKMESFRIPPSRKKDIRSLHETHGLLKRSLSDLRQRVSILEGNVLQKQKEWEEFGAIYALDDLLEALSSAHEEGKLESRITESEIKIAEMHQHIDAEINLLPLWQGSRDDFSALQIRILDETIQKSIEEERAQKEEILTWKQKINTEEEHLEAARMNLRNLEASTMIPTEEHLIEARDERDAGWKLVRQTLEGKEIEEAAVARYAGKESLADMYENHSSKADELADVMRRESAKVGMKQKYLNDIEGANLRIKDCKHTLEHLLKEERTFHARWKSVWMEYGIDALSPQEMKAWMAKYKEIKQLLSVCKKEEEACALLAQKSMCLKERLYEALSSLKTSEASLHEYSLEHLLKEASAFKDKELNRINDKKAIETEWRNRKEDLAKVKDELNEKESELEEWEKAWQEAIHPLSVDASAPTETALEQIERYDRCIQLYDEWSELNIKMNASLSFTADYDKRIDDILERLGWSKPAHIPSLAFKLAEELRQQQQNQRDEKEWQSQLEKRLVEYQMAVSKKQKAEASIQRLYELAGVETEDQLQAVEEQFARKQELIRKIDGVKAMIQDIAGVQSILELEQEVKNQDMDLLEVRLAELKLELTEIDENRSIANQAFGVCKKEYEEKIQGNSISTVMATEERESIVAELSSLCEQYVEKRLAVMVLQKGIEYYRAQNQNPILTRASDLFARLTLHSFEGLTVDYNEKDEEVLLGVKNGEKVGIEAMSDGTKDQLYLALRVASIEKYCEENEPIPFIVDDILVHFDNDRSKVTLAILEELSKKTQIIFFTHHAHLIDLIGESLDERDYQFIEINKETVMQ
ncbi:AAA family ATPase [Pradoshia sp.]